MGKDILSSQSNGASSLFGCRVSEEDRAWENDGAWENHGAWENGGACRDDDADENADGACENAFCDVDACESRWARARPVTCLVS